jgi:acyl-CoA synthetase (AMP-forming)/AMP-acid ligase II
MPQAVAQRLWEQYGLRFAEGYGLTETAAPSHSNPYDATKQQCLGVPFVSCDSRIIDPITLKEVPQGEQGEIIMSGPQVFQGYWKRPDATADAFIEIDGKRFFRSGDLGRMDEQGYFFMKITAAKPSCHALHPATCARHRLADRRQHPHASRTGAWSAPHRHRRRHTCRATASPAPTPTCPATS